MTHFVYSNEIYEIIEKEITKFPRLHSDYLPTHFIRLFKEPERYIGNIILKSIEGQLVLYVSLFHEWDSHCFDLSDPDLFKRLEKL